MSGAASRADGRAWAQHGERAAKAIAGTACGSPTLWAARRAGSGSRRRHGMQRAGRQRESAAILEGGAANVRDRRGELAASAVCVHGQCERRRGEWPAGVGTAAASVRGWCEGRHGEVELPARLQWTMGLLVARPRYVAVGDMDVVWDTVKVSPRWYVPAWHCRRLPDEAHAEPRSSGANRTVR